MRDQTNCPNCGSPITGFKCEYCGTTFYDLASIDVNHPCYLRLSVEDQIAEFMVRVSTMEVGFCPAPLTVTTLDRMNPYYIVGTPTSHQITLTLDVIGEIKLKEKGE